MAKTLRHEMRYDADVDAVATMLMDEAFRRQVCDAQHVLSHDVSITAGPPATVRVEQVQSAEGIPSFATKIVGDRITIVQQETWRTPTEGDIVVEIPGKPGSMRGTATLSPAGAGTVEVVELEIKVSIPLVGGKVESLVADMLRKALEKENEVGRTWLAGGGAGA